MQYIHKPVLINKIDALIPFKEFKLIIDATLGLGGHTKFFLLNSNAKVIAIDKDKYSIEIAKENLKDFLERVIFIEGDFINIKEYLREAGFKKADFIFADLGVSSYQLEDEKRGFTFQKKAPLDMRYNTRQSLTAAEVVNKLDEKTLTTIFKMYGEEPFSKKIAKAIIEKRKRNQINSTEELVEIVKEVKKSRNRKHHPATLIFQALRIYVNDEIESLKKLLSNAIEVLENKGYLAIISYHSLEDRIVKNFFKKASLLCECNKIPCRCGGKKIFSLITKKAIKPDKEEIIKNPRARSGKLRIIKKQLDSYLVFMA